MNQKNKVFEQYVLWFADLISIVIAFYLATYIRFGNFKDMGDKYSHNMVCLCFLLFSTIYAFFLEWNRSFIVRGYWKELIAVLQYNMLMFLVVEAVMYFFKWADVFSRLVMVYFLIGNTILTWLIHVLLKRFFYAYYKSDLTGIKIMVIAESGNLEKTLASLKEHLDLHYQITSAVCMDRDLTGSEICGIPVIADAEHLMEVARREALDEVLITIPGRPMSELEKLIQDFDEMGVVVHRKLEADVYGGNRSKIEPFGEYTVITCVRFQSGYKRLLIKRAMDVIGALVGLLITAILTPFVALAIKLDSRGPVFFSQVRIGRNGRRFKIYKFRSMYLDAEERKKELEAQNEINGLMFKMEHDPRITKVGRFIRKTSLDELPQFWNVLKGDMSLVGTRPPTEDEFEKYSLYYRRRLSITPGLTGMWQVSGRSSIEDFDDVVKLDLKYIDNWSLGLDIKILLQTILVVFTGRGSK